MMRKYSSISDWFSDIGWVDLLVTGIVAILVAGPILLGHFVAHWCYWILIPTGIFSLILIIILLLFHDDDFTVCN